MWPGAHRAVVEQREPVLDRRQAVRDLREVAEPELLLLFEVERAVVGRDALQRALAQRLVEHRLVALLAQRRRADVLGALEARPVEVVDGQVEVLDAGLAEDRQAAVARRRISLHRLLAGDVHDEQRPLGPLGEPDRAARGLALDLGRARPGVVLGVGVAGRHRLLLVAHDGVAVLAVDHHQAAGLAGLLEHGQELLVVDHQRALVGHEDLEGRDALVDAVAHLGDHARLRVGDRHVEAVVDVRGAVGAPVPLLARVLQRPADVLDDEVDDAGRPARGGRRGAGVVVVATPGAAERHREVGVVVDQPRQHQAAGGVDLFVGRKAGPDRDDRLALDQHVGVERVGGGDDPPTPDETTHARRLNLRRRGGRYNGRPWVDSLLIVAFFLTALPGVAQAATWSSPMLIAPQLVTTSVSCPSTTFCAAVGGANASIYDGATWSTPVPVGDDTALQAVACPAPGMCIAVGKNGVVATLAGGKWTAGVIAGAKSIPALSCPTTTFCRALDVDGNEFVLDHGNWSAGTPTGVTSVVAVSCPSTSFCAALERSGGVVTYSGGTWGARTPVLGNHASAIACSSASFCAAVSETTTSVFNGSKWTEKGLGLPVAYFGTASISCPVRMGPASP